MPSRQRFAFFLLVGCGLLTAGCGGRPGARVQGKVTFDDVPLTTGSVVFVSEDGSRSESGLITDGIYAIARAPVGPVKVYVVVPQLPPTPTRAMVLPPDRKPPTTVSEKDKDMVKVPDLELSDDKVQAMELASKVPLTFRNPNSTPLRYTVQASENSYDVVLRSVPGGPGGPGVPPPPPGGPQPPGIPLPPGVPQPPGFPR